jgi:hypothetical protein
MKLKSIQKLMLQNIDEAKESDQFKTPKRILKMIRDKLRIKEREIFNVCPFRPFWKELLQ